MRFVLSFALMAFASIVIAGGAAKIHDTTTAVVCTPNPVALNAASTCTVTVTDLGGQGPDTAPAGDVNFSSDGTGNFSTAACSVVAGPNATSSCSVTYTPTVFGSGTHTITAAYTGGADPNPATGIVFNPSSGSVGLAISYPSLTITDISPGFGSRGETVNVTITGTNFISGATTLSLGPNITVNALTVTNSTQMTAMLSIGDAAITGLRDVTVTNPAPGGGSATLANGFDVRNPMPVINSLSPAAVEVGSGGVVVTIDGSGFVSDSVAYFDGSPRATTFVNSTQVQMTLAAADTAAIGSYPVHVQNAAPGGGTSNTVTFSVLASGGSFDTVEPNASLGSAMFTKLAGVAFGVDVLATELSRLAVDTSFTGTVKVELLNASDDSAGMDANGCRASWTVVQTLPGGTFTAADNGRISVNTNHPNALRVARFRISYPATGVPSHVGCSSDAFSIRPVALAVSSPLTNADATGAPTHPAGTAFTITADAVSGYDGTPWINTSALGVPVGLLEGVLSGSFNAANTASGTSTGNSFTYTEVGSFTLPPGGIYDDSFTAVDQPDDCTTDFSNALVDGKYGCWFGSATALDVGRFVPAYFDVAVTDACTDAGGFTYSGQPFEVVVTARESGGARTWNYEGDYARDVTLSDAGATSNFDTGTNFVTDSLFSDGMVTNTVTTYRFPSSETDYTMIAMRAVDTEGVSSAGHLEESTQVRSGRLIIADGTAITTNAGLVDVVLQSWRETSPGVFAWATHTEDTTCTTPTAGNFSLQFPGSGNLTVGETAITGFFFNAGQGALTLSAPGTGNDGTVEIPGTTDSWLYFDHGTGTAVAPKGKMTFFEIFATEPGLIQRHEVVP